MQVRHEYLNEIGLGHLSATSIRRWARNRKRENVEARAALMNALSIFANRTDTAAVFFKDHATALHALRQHDTYLAYSPHYGRCYEIATRIVGKVADKMEMYPIGKYKHLITSASQLEVLELTISNLRKTLSDVQGRIEKNTNPVREYRRVLDI